MADPPIPHAAALPPPPPPLSPARSSMPMLYYGIVVIGTAAIVLLLYNLIIVRWCADLSDPRSRWRSDGVPGPASSWRFHHLHIASFKYRKDGEEDQSDCAVCLSAFEEDEELRQLPKCKHRFHAPCIDMWLHSHMDCPLCRCAVEPQGAPRRTAAPEQQPPPPENYLEGLLLPVTV